MIYLITAHDRQKRLARIDDPKQLKTKFWDSVCELTAHKTVLYSIETFDAFDKKALPNRVNIVYAKSNRQTRHLPNVLVNNNFKDIVETFGNKNEDIYIIGSTQDIVETFSKDADYIIDYSTDEIGHTLQSIFDSINFADYTLLKKKEYPEFDIRYFVREKTNFIGN